MRFYYEGLTHVTMDAEKSYDLLFASWRHRKANDIVPVQTRRPDNLGRQWY